MGNERYVLSSNEEHFHSDEFATREEAAAAAMDHLGIGHDERFWTGVPAPAPVPVPDADAVIERAQEAACDEVGEAAEDWLDDVTKEQRAELDAQLKDVWLAWLERHGHAPRYFAVHDIEVHRTPVATAEEAATCRCHDCRRRREGGANG